MTPSNVAVLDRVILDVHREPLVVGSSDGPFGHGPREQHAVVLEPEVVVQVAGEVLLHAEEQRSAASSWRGASPAGSGDFVKLRFLRYSSRAMPTVLSALRPSVFEIGLRSRPHDQAGDDGNGADRAEQLSSGNDS